jgi:hypothetical protein
MSSQFDRYRVASAGVEILYTGTADSAAGVVYLKTHADDSTSTFVASPSVADLHSDRFAVGGPAIRWVSAPVGGAALDYRSVGGSNIDHTSLAVLADGMIENMTLTLTVTMNIEVLPKYNTVAAWLSDKGHAGTNGHFKQLRDAAMGGASAGLRRGSQIATELVISQLLTLMRSKMLGYSSHAYRANAIEYH